MLVSCSKLLLAVALQRTEGHIDACFLPHRWQQLGVVYCLVRAVGGEDGGAHVSADLCFAQYAWSARARVLLQRGSCAVPMAMPAADDPRPSLHCVASSESGEAASRVMRSILEEDVMLGLGAEVRHGCVESGLRVGSGSGRRWLGKREKASFRRAAN
jgi:hypothetical protein